MDRPPSLELNPQRALLLTRVIWGAMVFTVTIVAVGLVVLGRQSQAQPIDPQTISNLFYIAIGLSVLTIFAAPFIRGQVFKSGWVGDVVKPQSYLAGNLMAWAICEGVAMVGLIVAFVAGSWWPYGLPAAAMYVMLLLLWPNGRAMHPSRDPYATGSRLS